jgi:aryl-alcohol dehydrogenase-like predicted oxidoreductase
MECRRFIEAAGGWAPFRGALAALASVARRRGATVSAVALRWVLDHPAVGCAIVGARLTEREHRAAGLAAFDVARRRRRQG